MRKSNQPSRREFLAGSAVALAGITAGAFNLGSAIAPSEANAAKEQPDFPVSIRVDAAKTKGGLRPIWRFFGADEPNYATMKDGQKLMANWASSRPNMFISARTIC